MTRIFLGFPRSDDVGSAGTLDYASLLLPNSKIHIYFFVNFGSVLFQNGEIWEI